ncbi:hypothetical protein [Mucilaginibacter ginsenosidivorax]|uniref:Uncharacterized protein n=1 Tax=Mucilaginibacter ginsenosidivorax TaxID=862126 RepID=A0A5B8VWL1_9SPHI|nr:hypothetical protein [Mucilaginibacter ginsenosidivorax]QEC74628.1 hypothetical protein FSB76_01195 [Mucilaginibacter ginsenosidivorax]
MKNLKMSESEYKELVLAEYDRQMKNEPSLSALLVPTPAKIKSLVIMICEQGSKLSTGDEKILESFVGKKDNAAGYRKAFSTGKADPFRPLVNLFDDRSIKTNIRNIDLLALLIGFKPRPYHPSLPATITFDPPIKPAPPEIVTDEPPGNPDPSENPVEPGEEPTKGKSYKFLWIIAAVIIAGMSWYLISKKMEKHYTGKEGCMIWDDDHYEPIECKDRSSDAPHYPINQELVDHFKRISEPKKTLTYQSVGKVWYSNYKGSVQFYTDSGPNPLDTNLRVLPMTTHIFEKYVLHIKN